MRALGVLAIAMLTFARSATGAPHKILVLPVEGTADPAARARLTQQIARLARGLEGQVATAGATFADTALAVGCDPQAPICTDQVMATLAVDELVWATATTDAGRTRLVVRRATRGSATREISTVISPGDATERSDAGLAPLFAPPGAASTANAPQTIRTGRAAPALEPAARPPAPLAREPAVAAPLAADPAPRPVALDPEGAHRDRSVGIAFAVGSGISLAIGIALWASYASLQTSIDGHATTTRAELDDLVSLEDRASTYAIAGDVLVVAGLAAGGLAAYYLVKSHRGSRIAIAPAPIAHGGGLTLTVLGGL